MRNWFTLCVVGVIAFSIAVAPAASAATISNWTSTPMTVTDKQFTLISTDLAAADQVFADDYGYGYHVFSLDLANNQMTNVTKHLVFRVTIVDDGATPANETLTKQFQQVSGDGNRYIASGTFTTSGIFDDSANLLSPLATFSNAGTPWGPALFPVAPPVRDLYVSLTIAAAGTTLLTDYSIAFFQELTPVPTLKVGWGQMKAMYR